MATDDSPYQSTRASKRRKLNGTVLISSSPVIESPSLDAIKKVSKTTHPPRGRRNVRISSNSEAEAGVSNTSAENTLETVQERLAKPKRGRPRLHPQAATTVSPSPKPEARLTVINGTASLTNGEDTPEYKAVNSGQLLYHTNRKRGRPTKYGEDKAVQKFVLAPYVEEQVELTEELLPLPEGDLDVRIFFSELPQTESNATILEFLKLVLLEKLVQRKPLRPVGLDAESAKLLQLLEQTVAAGEGNSALLIGAKGGGKTAMLNSVLDRLRVEHGSDFHTIRLNGYIHTDDKLALREIWRQLGRELEPDEEDDEEDGDNAGQNDTNCEGDANGTAKRNRPRLPAKTIDYADTLASLLALLSHPGEFSADPDPSQTAKAVLFIIDELDLFANHPRQTLLYNLFDIAQARKAPIAVLGLTSRINVVESLEKRVKSRFSHRYIHIPQPDLAGYWAICRSALVVTDEEVAALSNNHVLCSSAASELRANWTAMIDDLYKRSEAFKSHVERHFTSGSVGSFLSDTLLPISSTTLSTLPLSGIAFLAQPLSAPDSKLSMLSGLPDLALALLIAGARLNVQYDVDTCNLNMAYAEYGRLAANMRTSYMVAGAVATGLGSRIWSKNAAAKAWEELVAVELVLPAVSSVVGISGKARMYRFDVALEEIASVVSGTYLGKWCRDL
ncbi:MAG: hypothetical protein M1814_000389 [Vezdaea aestivalis]|nr:MAG: hypothetical protein M1814_000389 [Vezdaea aestivalis]